MQDILQRFFKAARAAGVRISTAETIDANRAVAALGFADRAIMRDVLLLTLAKTLDEKQALAACFDAFFDIPAQAASRTESARTGTAAPETTPAGHTDLGDLAHMLLAGDPSATATAIAAAVKSASLTDIKLFTQRGIYANRIFEAMGSQRLQEDIDSLARADPAGAERLAAGRDALRQTISEYVSQALLLYGREHREKLRNEALAAAPLARLDPSQIREMRELIGRMAKKLRDRYARRRPKHRRGHLEVRKTMRLNAAWGGVPFRTAWRRRKRQKPRLIAICDVSGSVARVSDFFLLLVYSLHDVIADIRSFAFSGRLIEVSDIFDSSPLEEAMTRIMSEVGYDSSDYGNSLAGFENNWMKLVTSRTTVIILGDARNNRLEPRADIVRGISERAKRLIWLNPERKTSWGLGDSVMPRYAPYCSVVRECANAKQLERAVAQIISAYD